MPTGWCIDTTKCNMIFQVQPPLPPFPAPRPNKPAISINILWIEHSLNFHKRCHFLLSTASVDAEVNFPSVCWRGGFDCGLIFLWLQLEVKGYNDKLEILLMKILDRLTNFTVDPQRFNIIKEMVCSWYSCFLFSVSFWYVWLLPYSV